MNAERHKNRRIDREAVSNRSDELGDIRDRRKPLREEI